MKKHRSFKNSEQIKRPEEKKSKTAFYMAIFFSAVMIASVGGIFFSNPDESNAYSFGKYSFKSVNNGWATKINGKQVQFSFLPEQAANFKASEGAMSAMLNAAGIIISFNPNQETEAKLQVLELTRFEVAEAFMRSSSQKQVFYAVLNSSDLYGLPVITCANSSLIAPVVSVDYGVNTSIELQNGCIVVTAQDEQALLLINDYLKYRIYGVIDEKTG